MTVISPTFYTLLILPRISASVQRWCVQVNPYLFELVFLVQAAVILSPGYSYFLLCLALQRIRVVTALHWGRELALVRRRHYLASTFSMFVLLFELHNSSFDFCYSRGGPQLKISRLGTLELGSGLKYSDYSSAVGLRNLSSLKCLGFQNSDTTAWARNRVKC